MRLIGRIFVILFAFLLASLAAGMVLALGVVASDFGIDSDPVERVLFFGSAFLPESYAGATALLPALAAIVLAEGARIRGVLYYGVGGALIGLAAFYSIDLSEALENTTDITPVGHGLELVGAAGIVGGLVYWLIAGRNAGRWRSEQAQ
ncbi:MAG TPA: hypothetical protein VFK79_01150 [Xanthobacteraceae bacterium]|nr:hypothetical protein [Xanthobacteraceae bacterium]